MPASVEQVWFAGVHSDVGGTFDDDPRLPTITLKWITDGAIEEHLRLKPGAYAREVTLVPDDAFGKAHRMGWVWVLLTYRRRRLPRGAHAHASVRARLKEDAGYAGRIPPDPVWSDTEWLTAHDER